MELYYRVSLHLHSDACTTYHYDYLDIDFNSMDVQVNGHSVPLTAANMICLFILSVIKSSTDKTAII